MKLAALEFCCLYALSGTARLPTTEALTARGAAVRSRPGWAVCNYPSRSESGAGPSRRRGVASQPDLRIRRVLQRRRAERSPTDRRTQTQRATIGLPWPTFDQEQSVPAAARPATRGTVGVLCRLLPLLRRTGALQATTALAWSSVLQRHAEPGRGAGPERGQRPDRARTDTQSRGRRAPATTWWRCCMKPLRGGAHFSGPSAGATLQG